MTDILIPASGDFDAWQRSHDACLAVDWDGTCKDTQIPKWTRCFNRAVTEIWPALAPYQQQVDEVCYRVNLTDPETAGVPRWVALKIMMGQWRDMGLPVPDLGRFFEAVDLVETRGEKHGAETYRKYQSRFAYDDSPMRWSDLSDVYIAAESKVAEVFANCRETLEALGTSADLVVVSASKTEAVRQDLLDNRMAHLFRALCAQDFLPKKGILAGLVRKYERVLFIGDMQHDVRAARAAGCPAYLVKTGDEAASWAAAGPVLERFIAGQDDLPELIRP